MPDLQIAMRVPKLDRIRASRRFGAFAVLTLRGPRRPLKANRSAAPRDPWRHQTLANVELYRRARRPASVRGLEAERAFENRAPAPGTSSRWPGPTCPQTCVPNLPRH
jgi:hypothetical protein